MKKFFLLLLILAVFSFFPSKTNATSRADILINEIAWMGTIVSFNDEWIVLTI